MAIQSGRGFPVIGFFLVRGIMIGSKPVGGYDLGALVISGLQLDPLCFHERSHHFFNESLTLGLRRNGVQKKRMLHEELP